MGRSHGSDAWGSLFLGLSIVSADHHLSGPEVMDVNHRFLVSN